MIIKLLDQSEIKLTDKDVNLVITDSCMLIIKKDTTTLIPLAAIKTADIPNDMLDFTNQERPVDLSTIHGTTGND